MEEKELDIKFTHLLLSFSGILLLCGALNYSGFCFRELRYLSSEEQMESLFNIWNRSSLSERILIDGEYKVLERKNRYASFEEFLVKHPNCCQFNPDGGYDTGPPHFIDRITGYDSGSRILLKFNEEFIDQDGNIYNKQIEIVDRLQNCGESMW